MGTSSLGDYAVFGVLLLAGFAFVAAAMTANRLLRPASPSAAKGSTYESGVDPVGGNWAQVRLRYYVYAFLFVLFAVEAVFLFPWAVVAAGFGAVAAAEMGVFVAVLALGLAYAWRQGVLAWR